MKIIYKKVDDIKPDPRQPRQEFFDDKISEMAVSIKNEGIINPIEVDERNVIITGEMRWRAAKKAGLNKVPCKVLKLNSARRFIRQMQENVHHNSMTAWDTAKGFEKTIAFISSGSKSKGHEKHRPTEKYVWDLSRLYGLSKSTISDYLSLLSEPKNIQEALKENKIPHTKIREINSSAPKKYIRRLKSKILKEKYIPREGIGAICASLRRASLLIDKSKEEKIANEILSFDFKKPDNAPMNTRESIIAINNIFPDMGGILMPDVERARIISKKTIELEELLQEFPINKLKEPISKTSLSIQLNLLVEIIRSYLSSLKINHQIESAKVKLIELDGTAQKERENNKII